MRIPSTSHFSVVGACNDDGVAASARPPTDREAVRRVVRRVAAADRVAVVHRVAVAVAGRMAVVRMAVVAVAARKVVVRMVVAAVAVRLQAGRVEGWFVFS